MVPKLQNQSRSLTLKDIYPFHISTLNSRSRTKETMKSQGLGQSEAGWTTLSRVKGHPISIVTQGLGSAS